MSEKTSWEETLEDLGWKDRKVLWTRKIEALVNGAIDYDDWEEIAVPCAEVADRAVEACREAKKHLGETYITPCWSSFVPDLLNALTTVHGESDNPAETEVAKNLLACAEAADFWELSWVGRIEAVARGDGDRSILVACALVADKAIAEWGKDFLTTDVEAGSEIDGKPDPLPMMTGIGEQPSWLLFMGDMMTWEHVSTCGYEGDEVMRCAEVADAYESRQLVEA